MFSSSKKPYTAVTVQVDRLTGPEYDADDWNGIIDLIEVIRIQDTGPTEAARAIRKKLKYGSTHRQLRSLTILDGLMQNGGKRFQQTFADEALLERLRLLPRDDMTDPEVREKCNALFRQWSVHYRNTPGMASIATLYRELPKKARPTAAQSRVLRENEQQAREDANPFLADEEEEEPPSPAQLSLKQHQRRKSSLGISAGPSSLSPSQPRRPTLIDQIPSGSGLSLSTTSNTPPSLSKDKKKKKSKVKRQKFYLTQETPQIMKSIASSSIASTNLLNSLKFVNREAGELPSTNIDVMGRFETCKVLRREVLRYIQLVESEQWIGSLLQANDELVKSLMAWEIMEKGMEDDSDSEVESVITTVRKHSISQTQPGSLPTQMRGMNLGAEKAPAKPRRPAAPPVDDYDSESEAEGLDDDNPFGDHAAISN